MIAPPLTSPPGSVPTHWLGLQFRRLGCHLGINEGKAPRNGRELTTHSAIHPPGERPADWSRAFLKARLDSMRSARAFVAPARALLDLLPGRAERLDAEARGVEPLGPALRVETGLGDQVANELARIVELTPYAG